MQRTPKNISLGIDDSPLARQHRGGPVAVFNVEGHLESAMQVIMETSFI